MIKVGVGASGEQDSRQAGAAAAELALTKAGLKKADFAFVFSTIGHDHQNLLLGVSSIMKNTAFIGCSCGGLIGQEGIQDELRAVSVMVIASDEMEFLPVFARGLKDNSFGAGREIAQRINQNWPADPKVLIVFPDGIYVNPDSFFKGLEAHLKNPLPLVGGTAGETLAFKRTYQYFNGNVLQDSVSAVLISGDFDFITGVSHGAVPTGLEKTITKAEGNHIYEIDKEPAFNVFKDYLGQELTDLHGIVISGVCLGTKVPEELKEKYEEVILRIPLRLDKADDSLYMSADWPEGEKISICERNSERILRKTREMAEVIMEKLGNNRPKLVLQFNCLGRGREIMGERIARTEIEILQGTLGKDIPWLGWYCFGEIAPIGQKNYFHNWTDILFVVYNPLPQDTRL